MGKVSVETTESCGGAIQEKGYSRELWLDVLKVLSAPLIVLIHIMMN